MEDSTTNVATSAVVTSVAAPTNVPAAAIETPVAAPVPSSTDKPKVSFDAPRKPIRSDDMMDIEDDSENNDEDEDDF